MIERALTPYLLRDAGYYPVVTLTGPRQSGKTTLAKACFPSYKYVSLEEMENRALAKDDPRSFLARFGNKLLSTKSSGCPTCFPISKPRSTRMTAQDNTS
jgi:predicted AAA+ superfamily ATPase